jgi:GT2 family glycosyltransferase
MTTSVDIGSDGPAAELRSRLSRGEMDVLLNRYRNELAALQPPECDYQPYVSVVVCTCRREDRLRSLLQALREQEYGEFEIVVVDNSPCPGPAWEIAQEAKARYVVEPRPGIRYARNTGIRAADARLVAFIDDDCLPGSRWLAALVSGFRRPEVGACTGAILPMELRTEAQWLLEIRGGFNRGFTRRTFASDSPESAALCLPLHAWLCGSGANMAFRKSVLDEIGGFDEVLPSAEDIDAFFRVLRHGYDMVYEPAAMVRHHHPETYESLRRRVFDWGHGYMSYLLRIALTDGRYRWDAMKDIAQWFAYQVRRRLWPQMHGLDCYPASLTLREIAGGLAALAGYWRYPMKVRLARWCSRRW